MLSFHNPCVKGLMWFISHFGAALVAVEEAGDWSGIPDLLGHEFVKIGEGNFLFVNESLRCNDNQVFRFGQLKNTVEKQCRR